MKSVSAQPPAHPTPTQPSAVVNHHGALRRRIWQIALPAIGENLLLTSLMMVDTLMIARSQHGQVALAASGIAGVIMWRFHMTFGCIDKGTMATVARATGAGDHERLARSVAQSLLIAVVIGLFLSIGTALGASHFMRWMGAAPDVASAGVPFLAIIGMASIPRLIFSVASASMRATGDTRSPMWITLWMNLLNVLFNFPLIYGIPPIPALGFGGFAGLGLTGSGISTAIAITFASICAGWILFSGRLQFHLKPRHFRPNGHLIRTLLRISGPSFIEESLISFGLLIFYYFIASLGTAALAAHSIATRIESLSFMAGVGFAIAAAALVGQSLGQKNIDGARHAFRMSTKYSVILMSVLAVVLIIFAAPIVRLFSPDDFAVSDMAAMLLIIAAIEQPLLAIGMTLGGGLRGAGDTITPMISTIICNVCIRVGASYYLAFILGYGIVGIYIGTVIDWAARAIFLYVFYRWERWARVKI